MKRISILEKGSITNSVLVGILVVGCIAVGIVVGSNLNHNQLSDDQEASILDVVVDLSQEKQTSDLPKQEQVDEVMLKDEVQKSQEPDIIKEILEIPEEVVEAEIVIIDKGPTEEELQEIKRSKECRATIEKSLDLLIQGNQEILSFSQVMSDALDRRVKGLNSLVKKNNSYSFTDDYLILFVNSINELYQLDIDSTLALKNLTDLYVEYRQGAIDFINEDLERISNLPDDTFFKKSTCEGWEEYFTRHEEYIVDKQQQVLETREEILDHVSERSETYDQAFDILESKMSYGSSSNYFSAPDYTFEDSGNDSIWNWSYITSFNLAVDKITLELHDIANAIRY
jgi:hypothetical protein